jgi:RecA-family ATPase
MWFARFRGCGWPTHSSTPSAPRERVLIELDRDASRDECIQIGRVLMHDLAEEFGTAVLVDDSTFRPEQPVFVPPVDVTLARFDGEPLDVDRYLDAARELPQDAPEQRAGDERPGGDKVGLGRRNKALSDEAYRLRRQGRNVGQIIEVLLAMNAAICDPPLSADEVRTIARGKARIEPDPPEAETASDEPDSWTIPPAIDADEWSNAALTPRCIVENYLFADVAALIAPGSTGKTTATLYEAVHVTLGLPLWGLRVFTPGAVLIVTAEDRREFLVARLREICLALGLSDAQRARVRELVRIDDATTSTKRTATTLAEDIVKGCKAAGVLPVLVQFDPMVSFGIGEARVNDAEQGLIQAARIISGGLDCCARFIHHTGKAGARDKLVDQYAGRGGSALADGCRMVGVMQTLDAAELLKATGDQLGAEESAFAIHRPKLSYAPPQQVPLYVLRRGYAFELLAGRLATSPDARAEVLGEQLARFITSELDAGRRHTRNSLRELRPEGLTRADVEMALAWLEVRGRICELDNLTPDGKRPTKGARTYLAVMPQNGGATAER